MANVAYIADVQLRTCNKCGQTKHSDKFPLRRSEFTGLQYRNPICRACRNKSAIEWRNNNSEKAKLSGRKTDARRNKDRSERPIYHYRRKFGLTLEQKAEWLASQDGKCAICGTDKAPGKKGWCVDHDHKTNELRAILCVPCNAMLGNAKDNPRILRMAADYLEQHTEAKKPFAWSYSRLHGYEICPRQFNEKTLLGNWPEPDSEQQSWGKEVHAALAKALRNKQELPLKFAMYQKWVDRVLREKGELLVENECQWAIDRNKEPTTWFSKSVWMRAQADAVKVDLDFPGHAMVVDWKLGKSVNVDPLQLTLMALMVFAQYPKIYRVTAFFVWLTEDEQTCQVIDLDEVADHWAEVMPRVARLQKAIETENFPPLPNRLCRKYCSVKSCEYWGK